MISPEEIKQQALKWWTPLLQSYISNEAFFPRQIERIGKVSPAQITSQFENLQREIEVLYQHSKNVTGVGYLIKTAGYNFRRTGSHELPDNIIFENIEDYLYFTNRKKEWKLFILHYQQLIQNISSLKDWALHNTSWLTQPNIDWQAVIKVCGYFLTTPRPDLYLRQLPIEIHTKFIEDNAALITSLLDFLIPGHIRSTGQKKIAERYFLRQDEPLVRIRILDEQLSLQNRIMDISIPLSDFERIDWPAENILIAENKMNFLTLPLLSSAIAIWSGGGFNISYLKKALWLNNKSIYYWGDIDEHGFQILHQLRSYYPQVKSVMMDLDTFNAHARFTVNGQRNKADHLHLLTDEEDKLYKQLKSLEAKNRLEQEKIPQVYVDKVLYSLLKQL